MQGKNGCRMNQYHHLPLCQQENSTQHEGCDGGHHLNPQHVCLHVHAPQCKVRVTQLYLCTIYVYHLLEISEQRWRVQCNKVKWLHLITSTTTPCMISFSNQDDKKETRAGSVCTSRHNFMAALYVPHKSEEIQEKVTISAYKGGSGKELVGVLWLHKKGCYQLHKVLLAGCISRPSCSSD